MFKMVFKKFYQSKIIKMFNNNYLGEKINTVMNIPPFTNKIKLNFQQKNL